MQQCVSLHTDYLHVLYGIIRVLSLCQGRAWVTGVEQIIKYLKIK